MKITLGGASLGCRVDDRKINPGIAIYLLPHVSSGDGDLFLPAPTNRKILIR